jgi:fatty acid desaturase
LDVRQLAQETNIMIAIGEEIPGLNLRELAKVQSIHFQIKLAVYLLVLAILGGLVLWLPGMVRILPSLLLGLAFAHAVELQHQCLHNTAYRSKFWNRLIGVSLGLPSLVSFSDYQNSHLKHHRLLGTPADKEFFNYGYRKLTSFTTVIPHLWMVRHYKDVMGYIARSAIGQLVRREDANPVMAKRIRFEYQLMAVVLGAIAVVTIVFWTPTLLYLWLIPFVVAVPTHALIEMPEHIGCDRSIPNILVNTRTLKANKLLVWFVNGNNYHVEHHWMPGVPNDKFPVLHNFVQTRIEYFDSSYWIFYSQFFKNLRGKNLHGAWEREHTGEEKSADIAYASATVANSGKEGGSKAHKDRNG